MILLYVPARGGSKGVKNKNIRLLNNKPLITYTLEIVDFLIKEFGDKVIPFVSTDFEKIAHICVKILILQLNIEDPKNCLTIIHPSPLELTTQLIG